MSAPSGQGLSSDPALALKLWKHRARLGLSLCECLSPPHHTFLFLFHRCSHLHSTTFPLLYGRESELIARKTAAQCLVLYVTRKSCWLATAKVSFSVSLSICSPAFQCFFFFFLKVISKCQWNQFHCDLINQCFRLFMHLLRVVADALKHFMKNGWLVRAAPFEANRLRSISGTLAQRQPVQSEQLYKWCAVMETKEVTHCRVHLQNCVAWKQLSMNFQS